MAASRRGVLGNVFTVGGFTALSRVLGFVREMMQSRLLGAGMEQSAFTLAFSLPNMTRKIFGEGALSSAFVPVFKAEVDSGDAETARRLSRAVLTTLLAVLGSAAALVVIGLTAYLSAKSGISPRWELIARLVRILAPYMVFICGAAFGMAVLNSLGRFTEGAVMPALLNVAWIAALAGLWFFPGLSISSRAAVVCWAILGGGLLQMLFLLHCMRRRGFAFRPLRPSRLAPGRESEAFRKVWRNTLTAALGAGAVHVNCMLDQVLAQAAAPWAAGAIGYAERLMDLPLGVVGVAFGTVLLPTFSGLFARGDMDGARNALSSSVRQMMFVMLPAGAALFALAPEAVSIVYEGRAFDSVATVRVSRALAVYALGLGFFGLQKALVPWFHAQNDMKTPLRVAVRMVFLNAALNIAAVKFLPVEWRHAGLAASTVFCSAVGAALLVANASRKNGGIGLASAVGPVAATAAAAVCTGLAIAAMRPVVAGLPRFAAFAVLAASGLAAYALLAALFMRRELKGLSRIVRRRRGNG